MAMRASWLLLAFGTSTTFACVAPDCDRVDSGTCVNACCRLGWSVPFPPKIAVSMVAAALAANGPDGRYYSVEGNAVQPWNSATTWVVQGIHTTMKHIYNDTLNIAAEVVSGGDPTAGPSIVHTFSHSQDFIGGNFAYGDYGQNYKNIVVLMQSVFGDAVRKTEEWSAGWGCPPPKNVSASAAAAEAEHLLILGKVNSNTSCDQLASPDNATSCMIHYPAAQGHCAEFEAVEGFDKPCFELYWANKGYEYANYTNGECGASFTRTTDNVTVCEGVWILSKDIP